MRKSTKKTVKWVSYIAVLLVLFVLQTTPGLFSIMGVRPILILPFAICFSMFETEKRSAIIGALAGGLLDISSAKLFGFSAAILMICCVACSLLVMYLAKLNIANAIFLCATTLGVYLLLDFTFYYAIWGFDNLGVILLQNMLPMAIYTLAITPLIYLGTRKLYYTFNDPVDQ